MEQQILNNRYRIEQKLGEGGMASVYLAQDLRLNRRVAIKILHAQFRNDPDFLNRFQHEAQSAAILNHANVVSVYDVGQDDETHYIVMQYVEGVNLKTLINQKGSLMVAQAVTIAEAIAEGIEAAHQVGLIHRDIKPHNVMVGPDGHVQITDFGIAKSHLSTALTQTGMTFGTADYISPEQAQGLLASPRSDIYSLGITLYEMLTGRLPFTGESAVSVAMQHISTEPPPPQQLNPNIPNNLAVIVLKAIAKDPNERPASAKEFAQMLRSYRNNADQATLVSSMPLPPQPVNAAPQAPSQPHHPTPPRPSGSSGSSSTGSRNTMPPARPAVAKAPQQKGIGCGIFIVGMVIMLGVLGLVFLFVSGSFETMFAFDNGGTRSTPTITSTPNATATTTTTPTPSPTPSPTPRPTVVVPNIVGVNENEARQILFAVNLVPIKGGSSHHDIIQAGSVIDQMVPSKTEVEEGRQVTYTLSLGRKVQLIDAPNLISRRLESARNEAQGLGLRIEVVEEPSTTVSEGFVIRQEPVAGMRLEQGDTIKLVVSIGDKVWMPDLMGMNEADAKATIESTDGLHLSWVDYQGFDKLGNMYYQVQPGIVVSTSPDKNLWVVRGTGVTIGVREYDANNSPDQGN